MRRSAGSASAARSARTSPAAPTACRICATSCAATGIRRGDAFDEVTPESPPVLIIHGFLGTRGSMYMLERRLVEDGFVVVSFNLGTLNVRDIRRSAFLIHRKIERILAQTPSQRIDIIGHSMGGLIGLYYVKKLGGHARVRKLIMMGTPVRGHLGRARGRRDARPVVDVVVAAPAAEPVPRRARAGADAARRRGHTIAAARDWVVPLADDPACRGERDDRPPGPFEPRGVRRGLPARRQHAPAATSGTVTTDEDLPRRPTRSRAFACAPAHIGH